MSSVPYRPWHRLGRNGGRGGRSRWPRGSKGPEPGSDQARYKRVWSTGFHFIDTQLYSVGYVSRAYTLCYWKNCIKLSCFLTGLSFRLKRSVIPESPVFLRRYSRMRGNDSRKETSLILIIK